VPENETGPTPRTRLLKIRGEIDWAAPLTIGRDRKENGEIEADAVRRHCARVNDTSS